MTTGLIDDVQCETASVDSQSDRALCFTEIEQKLLKGAELARLQGVVDIILQNYSIRFRLTLYQQYIRGARFKIACFPLSYATKCKHQLHTGSAWKKVKGPLTIFVQGKIGERLGRASRRCQGVRQLQTLQKLQRVVSGHSDWVPSTL